MNTLEIDNINIFSTDCNFPESLNYIPSNTTIVFIGENFLLYKELLKLHKQNQIEKLILLKKSSILQNYFSIKNIHNNFILILSLNNDFYDTAWIVKTLINIKKIKDSKLHLGIKIDNKNFIGFIDNSSNSLYYSDLVTALKALHISNCKTKYSFIYDTVCQYLDTEFSKKNFCDFKNDKCIANRKGKTAHSTMGCCYSFEYCSFFSPNFIQNVHLCNHLENKTCNTSCITCKLFTCSFLKEQYIKFNTHKILLLQCFFNNKQHLILNSNFFKTKEKILEKLLEPNNDFYLYYMLRQKYRI